MLILGTSVGDSFPSLLLTDRRPGSRFLNTYPVAFFRHGDGPAWRTRAPNEDEARFIRDLVQDIRARRPPLLLVRTGRLDHMPPYITMMDYLKTMGIWEAALADYVPLAPIPGYDVYLSPQRAAEEGRMVTGK